MKRILGLYFLVLSVSYLISVAAFANVQNREGSGKPLDSVDHSQAESTGPLTLIQTVGLVDVPSFPFMDHLAVDVKGHRLFATPQARKSVQVFDLNTGELLHEMSGMGNPHSVLYRSDLDRIYVSDGEPGLVRIYDGRDYHLLQTIKLPPDADNFGYDPATKYLYVSTSGAAEIHHGIVHLNSTTPKLDYSLLNIVDTTTGKLVGDIKIPGPIIEQMALESSGSRIYINVTSANEIAVLDREHRTVGARWPITRATKNFSVALDEAHDRLFVGCRDTDEHGGLSGVIVILDTRTGKEIGALPIGGWIDNLYFDPASRRLFASCGTGYVYVYQQGGPDHFDLIARAETGLLARTGLLVPELKRYFAAVPHIGSQTSKILIFQVN